MKVAIKDIDVDIALGNNGVMFEIRDNNDKFRGKLRLGRATVEWCPGKISIGNGKKKKLEDVISWFEDQS